jgi:glycosyltransferase involved in cell wall biosynthesis
VVWWTSNFAHHFKTFRSDTWQDVQAWNGFQIRLVPSTSYRRNIGLGRILRDAVFAVRTYLRGRTEPRPDLIIFSESPLTFGFAGQRLAEFHGCPSIYHQMDLWPELIVEAVPPKLRRLVQTILWPVYAVRRRTYSRISAATALARHYQEAVFDVAPVLRSRPSAVVYNGIDVAEFRAKMISGVVPASRFPEKKEGELWAVFAGSLGPSYDINVMCEVACSLAELSSKIHIVIAGDGPMRHVVESTARGELGNANLYFLGQLSPGELAALYSRCDIGLCAYSASSNVEMPDKIYDYTAAGLPVLVSLRGEVADIVASENIGLSYVGGDKADLLNKLHEISSDAKAMQKMSNASLGLGMQFDKNVQYKKIIDVVNRVAYRDRAPN